MKGPLQNSSEGKTINKGLTGIDSPRVCHPEAHQYFPDVLLFPWFAPDTDSIYFVESIYTILKSSFTPTITRINFIFD